MTSIKLRLNMVINALSLMAFMALFSTGLLIHYVLPQGSGGLGDGFGHGRGKSVLSYLGLTRHEWGEIHFYIALLFLALLTVHILLHWSWIRCIAWGNKTNPQSALRRFITVGIVTVIVAAISFPFVFEKQVVSNRDSLRQVSLETGNP